MGNPLVRFCEGPRHNRRYGWDKAAPPGNHAANGENKLQPAATEVLGLLDICHPTRSYLLKINW